MPALKCELCDTTSKIPACCNRAMVLTEDKFTCTQCGKEISVPKCCGNQMLLFTV